MKENEDIELKDLHKSLSERIDPKKFGLRNGYIYSHVILKLIFELFIEKNKIGIKPSKPNLDEIEIEYLTRLIQKIDPDFRHRNYGEKNVYSVWELDVSSQTDIEIGNVLKSIEEKLF